ncbi:MAG: YicC/YloC family endoribonuclease [Succinivibrionaceae bacterium]
MINSMTGYAYLETKTTWGTFTWNIKSVNHRYLDISLKLPDNLNSIESELRESLRNNLERGKVECTLTFNAATNETDVAMNEELAEQLVKCARKISSFAGDSNIKNIFFNPVDILLCPGVLNTRSGDPDAIQSAAIDSFNQAITQLKTSRAREGEKLLGILQDKLNKVSKEVEKVKASLPDVLNWQKEKLLSAFNNLKIELDPDRLEQEMIIVAQRLDVAEELDRLALHVSETYNILKKGGTCGRRLDFMMQEFNRESNTLASKSINTDITNSAIELKVLIEQMREQIQNIE